MDRALEVSFKMLRPRGVLSYICPSGYLPPQRVGILRRFDLKTGIGFAYFGLESGMVFDETTGVYERIYHFSSTEEKKICKFEMNFKKSFL